MSKHTKGDWQVAGSPSGSGGYSIVSGETYIAECYCGGSDEGQAQQGECEGNAQLIASAPTLLKELKLSERWFDKLCTDMDFTPCDKNLIALLDVARQRIKDAIYLAEGNK